MPIMKSYIELLVTNTVHNGHKLTHRVEKELYLHHHPKREKIGKNSVPSSTPLTSVFVFSDVVEGEPLLILADHRTVHLLS